MRYDIVVLGSGPAGLSAAVAARGRNKSVLVVGNRWQDSPLARAECVDNYLGLPSMTGAELMDRFTRHAEESGHRQGDLPHGLEGVPPDGGQ